MSTKHCAHDTHTHIHNLLNVYFKYDGIWYGHFSKYSMRDWKWMCVRQQWRCHIKNDTFFPFIGSLHISQMNTKYFIRNVYSIFGNAWKRTLCLVCISNKRTKKRSNRIVWRKQFVQGFTFSHYLCTSRFQLGEIYSCSAISTSFWRKKNKVHIFSIQILYLLFRRLPLYICFRFCHFHMLSAAISRYLVLCVCTSIFWCFF